MDNYVRQYGMLAIDGSGQVIVLADTDTNPATVTIPVNHTGYAFELIYDIVNIRTETLSIT